MIDFISISLVILVVVVAIRTLSFFANNLKLIDYPSYRKKHKNNVPLVGGIAMFIGFMFGAVMIASDYIQIKSLLLISSIMLLVGIVDDGIGLKVSIRLIVEIFVAIFCVNVLGIELKSFGNLFGFGNLLLGDFAFIVTILAIVGGINSFNVTDGIDGLAGGIALISFSSVFFIAYFEGHDALLNLSSVYLLILIPFIFFNMSSNKKIFMGDAGTLFIGISLVWILIVASQGSVALFHPVTALWLFAVPLMDILIVIFFRLKQKKSLFLPDHLHLHYRIVEHYNFSELKTLVIILTLAVGFALIGIFGHIYNVAEWVMFMGFLFVFIVYFIFCNKMDNKSKNNLN